MVQLSLFEKGRLCGMLEAGLTVRDVAGRMNLSTRTVQKWWTSFINEGKCNRHSGSGRPRKSSVSQDASLVLKVKRNRFKSMSVVGREWINENDLKCSLETARRRVVSAGYHARRAVVTIPLTAIHKRNRLSWAREHLEWNSEQWRSVLWTDESRFTLDFNDGRILVRRKKNERFADCCIKQHDRYGGGSVMIWCGIWWEGRTDPVIIDGSLTGVRYLHEIIEQYIIPNVTKHNLILQQDNARPHTAKIVADALCTRNVPVLPWPARSPDLSPIEHAWDDLGRRVRQIYSDIATTKEQLAKRLKEQWEHIPQENFQNLISSMGRRLQECIDKRGGHTSY